MNTERNLGMPGAIGVFAGALIVAGAVGAAEPTKAGGSAYSSVPGAQQAQVVGELPKEGNYDFTACWAGVNNLLEHSKTDLAVIYEYLGGIKSTQPNGLLDKTSLRCVGMRTALSGKRTLDNVCETTDGDGDKVLVRYSFTSDGKFTQQALSGTGKYEGIVLIAGPGDSVRFPEIKPLHFQGCARSTGTYKLK